MKTIDLKKIIKDNNLNPKHIAVQLFPRHKFPGLALRRVVSKKAVLDANQISRLSLLTGIPIAGLFGMDWKSKTQGNLTVFTCSGFHAELDSKTWITKIYDKESLFHESIIHTGSTPLSKYLVELGAIISNYKNQISK